MILNNKQSLQTSTKNVFSLNSDNSIIQRPSEKRIRCKKKREEERRKIEDVVLLTFYRSCTRSARKFDELVPRSLFLPLPQREGQIRIDGPLDAPITEAEIEITHFPDKS